MFRVVCIDFERGTLSAYAAIEGNRPMRMGRMGPYAPPSALREFDWSGGQLEQFRLDPVGFMSGVKTSHPDHPMDPVAA